MMRPIPEVMSPAAAVEVINSLDWPEEFAAITAELVPAHTEWGEDGEYVEPARILVRAEVQCAWMIHPKPYVTHTVTLATDGERDLHVDTVHSLTRNAWMALADHLVRTHAEPRLLTEIREQQADAQAQLDRFHAASYEGGPS
jgi:hypothetical protein